MRSALTSIDRNVTIPENNGRIPDTEKGNISITMKHFYSRIFFTGCLALSLASCDNTAAPAKATPPPPQVNVVKAHSETLPLTRESVGLLASTRIAEVRARVAGIVVQQVYKEGTDVEQGQTLFHIDPAQLQAALHAEEAALARARADAENANLIAKRSKDLEKKGLLSSQEMDTALANKRSTAAAVKEAQANVEKMRLDLTYATVTAPIAGRAGRAMVTEGALVGQNEATQLTTIEQIDPIYVNFSQSASELQQLRQDAAANTDRQVEILLQDGSAYPEPGILDFSDLAVNPRTGTVSLRALVSNPEHQLLPGMFVKLRVTLGHIDNAFLLPQATVLRDGSGAYVLVVTADGKVEQRRVQTNGMTLTDWIVSGDLADGEQVIVEGLQKVKPGAIAVATPIKDSDSKHAATTEDSGS